MSILLRNRPLVPSITNPWAEPNHGHSYALDSEQFDWLFTQLTFYYCGSNRVDTRRLYQCSQSSSVCSRTFHIHVCIIRSFWFFWIISLSLLTFQFTWGVRTLWTQVVEILPAGWRGDHAQVQTSMRATITSAQANLTLNLAASIDNTTRT